MFDLHGVSVVVLSHNRAEELAANLPILIEAARNTGLELIVVDNASTDGSVDMLREWAAGGDLKAILNETNLGVAGGRNSGWRAVTREFILNIDDDVAVSVAAIGALQATMRDEPDIGVISPRIVHPRTGAHQCDHGDSAMDIANFHGACHMLRRDLVGQVGLNDEACSFGGEELDYSIRVRAAGHRVVYTPRATVLHNNHTRPGGEDRSRRGRWVYNFLRVYHKHFPWTVASGLSGRYLARHLLSGLRAHGPVFPLTLIVAGLRGMRDGRRQHRRVPDDVTRFYRNPELRPDFGNVPLTRKAFGLLRRKARGA